MLTIFTTPTMQEAHRLVAVEKRERDHVTAGKEREAETARKMELWRQQVRRLQ